jgi:hypothetical protein
MARNPTERYLWGYAVVANTVDRMTPNQHRLAYDDAASMAEMRADCEQAGRNLGLERRLARAAEAATGPAPSIRFEDYPSEVPKRDIRISEAAQRLANALELHLD